MTHSFFKFSAYFLAAALLLSACGDDDSNETPVNPADTVSRYVLLTSVEKFGGGYLTTYQGMPSGDVTSVTSQSKAVTEAFGFRSYKNWLFTRTAPTGTVGLQRFTLTEDGSLKEDGFIAGSTQYLVVDETTGYYLDEDRGTLKLQTFNPTTMQRTGEIDLSSLRNEEIAEYQVIGKHILAAKEGKLYASVNYGTNENRGFGDDVIDHVELAVIDIASNKLDKVIKYDGLKALGWGSSGNKMWSLGDDGGLYLYSPGLSGGFAGSAIIRIKKGATDFDQDWIVKATDYNGPASLAIGLVRNGKLYVEMPSEPLQDDLSNFQNIIFDYYAIDIASGESTKITGMPQHHYVWSNEQGITEIDGQVYFWVHNIDQHLDAYYKLNANGTSATQAFNVDHDGYTWGFLRLKKED